MKIPDNYIRFSSFEEQNKKYREWDFRNRKKDELKDLFYKGSFLNDRSKSSEPCKIVGYTNELPEEMIVIIQLSESGTLLAIDRRYLKQMQDKHFSIDQNENDVESDESDKVSGEELIGLLENYTIYDIETTGRNNESDDIIEIAAVRVRKGTITDEFQSFIHPTIEIPKKITRLTGITNLMVSQSPDITDVLPEFKTFIGDDILIGHNIKTFDNNFISKSYETLELGRFINDYVDTLTIARKLYHELKSKSAEALIEHLKINHERPQHRALNDCYYEFEIYERMKKDIIEKFGSIEKFNDYHIPRKINNDDKNGNSDEDVSKQTAKKTKSYFESDDLRKVQTTQTEFNENNKFYGKICAITGDPRKGTKLEIAQLIVDLGGKCENNVTKKTNILIVSDNSDPNKKTGKLKKAEEYKLKGQDIEIISESVFYEMIDQS